MIHAVCVFVVVFILIFDVHDVVELYDFVTFSHWWTQDSGGRQPVDG